MLRPRLIPPDDVFPPNPWAIEAVRFDGRLGRELTGQAETMFALSNGHLGVRGIADEGRPVAEAGTYPQDDSFLDLETWDFAETPEDHYPLLLHYHPLNLYRAQVIKQADVVLAMFLLGDKFSPEAKRRNFNYYDPLTTHDSSLSVCIQSIVANEIGLRQTAIRYFNFAVTMDLSDIGGNMKHGAHIAAIGGTWLALVYGFAGLRDANGRLTFNPCLPDDWTRLSFALTVRGRMIRLEIGHGAATYRLLAGGELVLWHGDEGLRLTPEAPAVTRALRMPSDAARDG